MNHPLTFIRRGLIAGIALLATAAAHAQTMPQDTWRYDNLQFSSPTPANYLRCLGAGSGHIFAGEAGTASSSAATKVIQFTEAGAFVRRFTDTFGYILGIACDSAGNVYVLDRGDSRVKMFDSAGTFVRQWGGSGTADGQFTLTGAIGTCMIAVDRNNQIYVCDPGNARVQVFDTDGVFLRKWGQAGSLPGQYSTGYPRGITVTPDLRVLTTRSSTASIISDPTGTFIRAAGGLYGDMAAATPDGLIISAGNFDTTAQDITGAVVRTFTFNSSGIGLAVTRRGDIYMSIGTTIRAAEREYASVQNSLTPPAIPHPIVLASSQRPGTSWLDVDYRVSDLDSTTVQTAALVFKNGGNALSDVVRMNTFMEDTGLNLGTGIPVNTTKRLTWNMAADWTVDFGQIQVEVLAKDSRDLLGVHWITVPASGGDPAVQVSSRPVTDAELLDLWYWFVATGNSGVSFTNGTLTGTAGLYSDHRLAYSPTATTNATTTAGRLFAYGQLGVRAITGSILARAQAGNYGFTSLDGNTVVRATYASPSFADAWGTVAPGWGSYGTLAVSSGVTAVAAGYSHALVLTADGTLWGFGDNDYGQLGDGTTTYRANPVVVATGVTAMSAGWDFSVFIKSDGTLWGTGNNGSGQLGDGTTTNRSTPVQAATGAARVAAGYSHTLFTKSDNTLWAMGRNGYGQLGDGTTTQRTTPVLITTPTGVKEIEGGGDYSLYTDVSDQLYAMGRNTSGQLGDGSAAVLRTSPVLITTGVSKLAAGGAHSLFIKTDGSLWAMGQNQYGQLGDGTTAERRSPVQVASPATAVTAVAAGEGHSLFVRGGNVFAMGANWDGSLGDGTTTQRNTPVQARLHGSGVAAGERFSIGMFVAP